MPPESKRNRKKHLHNLLKRSRAEQDAETEQATTEQHKTDLEQATERLNASNSSSNDPADYTRTRGSKGPDTYRTSAAIYATIQTRGGIYESELNEGDTNNFPIQTKLGLTRYRISRPPRMMRNIAKYHTTKKMQQPQVRKFDIRNPDPGRQMRNRRGENSKHAYQACVIETMGQIQGKQTIHRSERRDKNTPKRNAGGKLRPKDTHALKQYSMEIGKGRKNKLDTMTRNDRQQEKAMPRGINC